MSVSLQSLELLKAPQVGKLDWCHIYSFMSHFVPMSYEFDLLRNQRSWNWSITGSTENMRNFHRCRMGEAKVIYGLLCPKN